MLSTVGSLAGEDLASQILADWQKHEDQFNIVEIIVDGTDDIANFEKLRRLINTVPGVKNLQIKELKPDEATLLVNFKGIAKELADDLIRNTFEPMSINIHEVSEDRLKIELTPG